jgi:DNA invertase Pin-like site-specific DNA recombinase
MHFRRHMVLIHAQFFSNMILERQRGGVQIVAQLISYHYRLPSFVKYVLPLPLLPLKVHATCSLNSQENSQSAHSST